MARQSSSSEQPASAEDLTRRRDYVQKVLGELLNRQTRFNEKKVIADGGAKSKAAGLQLMHGRRTLEDELLLLEENYQKHHTPEQAQAQLRPVQKVLDELCTVGWTLDALLPQPLSRIDSLALNTTDPWSL
jgi:hypothetical protein